MFATWRDGVQTYKNGLGINPEVAFRAHDVVCGAMGNAWLDAQASRIGRPSRGLEDVHPLYRSLTSATEESVVVVCETAAYLIAFRDDPQIGDIVRALRLNDRFEPTSFELAMAWRWRTAGAAISFAPGTPQGVADFDAIVDGKRFTVEVSAFPLDMFRHEDMAFTFAMQRALKKGLRGSLDLQFFVAAEIHVAAGADGNVRQEAYAAVSRQVRAFSGTDTTHDSALAESYTFGTIIVRRSRGRYGELSLRSDWPISSCLALQHLPDYGTLHGAQQLSQNATDTHWVHTRVERSPQQPYQQIARKLRDENRQLSKIPNEGVIILAVDGLQKGVFSSDDSELITVVGDFKRNHGAVSDIWLLTRVWKDGRRIYRGATIPLKASGISLPSVFVASVVDADETMDLFSII
jgi:hypothetical protein